MKTLICISNFGENQLSHLDIVLSEYNKYSSLDITVVLFSTQCNQWLIDKYPKLKIVEIVIDKSIGVGLAYQHKQYMISNMEMYDLFIYSENDILIKEKNVKKFIELSNICDNTAYVPGFIRFEICSGYDFISVVDCSPKHSVWNGGNKKKDVIKDLININGENFFSLFNVHSACYIFLQKEFKKIIQNVNYLKKTGYARELETSASGVYYNCGFVKVIHYKSLQDSLIHHLPNKYCAGSFSLDTLKDIYNKKFDLFKSKDDIQIVK